MEGVVISLQASLLAIQEIANSTLVPVILEPLRDAAPLTYYWNWYSLYSFQNPFSSWSKYTFSSIQFTQLWVVKRKQGILLSILCCCHKASKKLLMNSVSLATSPSQFQGATGLWLGKYGKVLREKHRGSGGFHAKVEKSCPGTRGVQTTHHSQRVSRRVATLLPFSVLLCSRTPGAVPRWLQRGHSQLGIDHEWGTSVGPQKSSSFPWSHFLCAQQSFMVTFVPVLTWPLEASHSEAGESYL